jgi:TetR/AcrR family transcriptional regulator, regulator of mycofactocin system
VSQTKPSPQERRNEHTRERIRAAAVKLFQENGYETTSVAEIADAADISQRTLFRYFRAKDDILFGKPESMLPLAQQVIIQLEGELSDWDVLQTALRTYAASMQAREEDIRPAVGLIHTIPELYPRRTLMQERWAEAIAAALATRRGQTEPGLDDHVIASAGLAVFATAVKRWLVEDGRALPDVVQEAFDRFHAASR